MATISTTPPRSFVQGSTVQWRIQNSDYPPSTWTATLVFVSESDTQTVTATDYGDGTHLVEIDDAASAAFEPAFYRYQVNVSDGSNRFTIDNGIVQVEQNYAAVSDGLDTRSDAAKIYDAITAVMTNKATHDQSSLSVGGRSLSRYSWDELGSERGRQAHLMTDAERMARGFMPRTLTQVRFVR